MFNTKLLVEKLNSHYGTTIESITHVNKLPFEERLCAYTDTITECLSDNEYHRAFVIKMAVVAGSKELFASMVWEKIEQLPTDFENYPSFSAWLNENFSTKKLPKFVVEKNRLGGHTIKTKENTFLVYDSKSLALECRQTVERNPNTLIEAANITEKSPYYISETIESECQKYDGKVFEEKWAKMGGAEFMEEHYPYELEGLLWDNSNLDYESIKEEFKERYNKDFASSSFKAANILNAMKLNISKIVNLEKVLEDYGALYLLNQMGIETKELPENLFIIKQ